MLAIAIMSVAVHQSNRHTFCFNAWAYGNASNWKFRLSSLQIYIRSL